jgi:predicted MFS family arabinose efflux permease
VSVAVTTESSLRYPGWRVVAVCFAMALFCWGFGFYGHSVFLAELQRQHGWPAAQIAGASTVSSLVTALLLVFVADVIRAMGLRPFVLAGAAMLGLSALLLPHVTAPWQVYAIYVLQAFSWAALGVVTITTLIGLWFTRKRGLAISLALNGASCAGIIISPSLVFLIEWRGFAVAMTIATAVMAAVLVPLVLAWVDAPRDAQPPAASASHERVAIEDRPQWTKGAALRSWPFWSVTAPFALAFASQVGFIVHQVAFLAPSLGRGGAGSAVAVMTAMAVVGRLVLGTVVDRLDQRAASAASLASQAAALLVMTQTDNGAALYAACAVYGFSVGNIITFPPLIVQREFDAASYALVVGLSTAVCQLISSLGPVLVGAARDLAGSYAVALWVCIALNVVAASAILMRAPAQQSG